MSKRTLQLTFPEWQGGVNPNYYFGSKLLSWLVPKGPSCECAEVPVDNTFPKETVTDSISYKEILMQQQTAAAQLLKIKQPERVIVLGGDCSVEQAPFDYLHGKYPEHTGILWIDAHPDFSRPKDFSHEHAMVLGNLIGAGAPDFAAMVQHPFARTDVLYVGLKADHLETWEEVYMAQEPIAYVEPSQLKSGSEPVLHWIRENGFEQVIVHWDLDVLSPEKFHSLLCAEPDIPPVEYAVGDMHLPEIIRLIRDVGEEAEIVGLGITEFLPWDCINLRKGLASLPIFND